MSNDISIYIELEDFVKKNDQKKINEKFLNLCQIGATFEEIKFFIESGCDPCIDNGHLFQDEFLHLCYWNGSLEAIQFMIKYGCDPHMNDDEPFIKSCANQNIDVPLYFIDKYNVNINSQNGKALEIAY